MWRQRRSFGVAGSATRTSRFNGQIVVPFAQSRAAVLAHQLVGTADALLALPHERRPTCRATPTRSTTRRRASGRAIRPRSPRRARAARRGPAAPAGAPHARSSRRPSRSSPSSATRSSRRSARRSRDRYGVSELAVSMTACARSRLHVDMEFGIVEVEPARGDATELGARAARRHGAREPTQRRSSAIGSATSARCAKRAVPVRPAGRRLRGRRRPHRGLRRRRPTAGSSAASTTSSRTQLDVPKRRSSRSRPTPSRSASCRGRATARTREQSSPGEIPRAPRRARSRSAIREVDAIPREPNGKFRAVKSRVGMLCVIRVGLARTEPSYAGRRPPWGPGQRLPGARSPARRSGRAGTAEPVYAGVRAALRGARPRRGPLRERRVEPARRARLAAAAAWC